ncbi:MAG: hypothetical protein WKF77_14550 [Planctomycetaceae bacterium]
MPVSDYTFFNDADNDTPPGGQASTPSLATHIVNGVERLVLDAIEKTKPLEVDPSRSQLFELFVAAEEAGLIADDSNVGVFDGFDEESSVTDLSADSLCRLLARRWGLDMAAREAQALQTRLPADQLERMRVLWSMMRMWMEWSYAWRRWSEFHP